MFHKKLNQSGKKISLSEKKIARLLHNPIPLPASLVTSKQAIGESLYSSYIHTDQHLLFVTYGNPLGSFLHPNSQDALNDKVEIDTYDTNTLELVSNKTITTDLSRFSIELITPNQKQLFGYYVEEITQRIYFAIYDVEEKKYFYNPQESYKRLRNFCLLKKGNILAIAKLRRSFEDCLVIIDPNGNQINKSKEFTEKYTANDDVEVTYIRKIFVLENDDIAVCDKYNIITILNPHLEVRASFYPPKEDEPRKVNVLNVVSLSENQICVLYLGLKHHDIHVFNYKTKALQPLLHEKARECINLYTTPDYLISNNTVFGKLNFWCKETLEHLGTRIVNCDALINLPDGRMLVKRNNSTSAFFPDFIPLSTRVKSKIEHELDFFPKAISGIVIEYLRENRSLFFDANTAKMEIESKPKAKPKKIKSNLNPKAESFISNIELIKLELVHTHQFPKELSEIVIGYLGESHSLFFAKNTAKMELESKPEAKPKNKKQSKS